MPARSTLTLSLLIAAVVVVLTPTAIRYGGIAPWGPWLPAGAALINLALAIAHGRRPDRSRPAAYFQLAVAVGCAFFSAWMFVQRLT